MNEAAARAAYRDALAAHRAGVISNQELDTTARRLVGVLGWVELARIERES